MATRFHRHVNVRASAFQGPHKTGRGNWPVSNSRFSVLLYFSMLFFFLPLPCAGIIATPRPVCVWAAALAGSDIKQPAPAEGATSMHYNLRGGGNV